MLGYRASSYRYEYPDLDSCQIYTHKQRGRAEWANTSVRHILRNQTYVGKWHYCKDTKGASLIEVGVPAIVSESKWKLAQDLRHDHLRTSKRNTKHEYLVQYRLTCECGYAIQAIELNERGKKYYYYHCQSDTGDAMHRNCGLLYYRADFVDWLVWDWLVKWFKNPADLRQKLEAYKAERDKANAPILAALKVNDDLIADNQTQLTRLLDLYQTGVFDLEIITARKAKLDEAIAGLMREHENMYHVLYLGKGQAKQTADSAGRQGQASCRLRAR